MGRVSGTSVIEGVVLDWVQHQPEPENRLPVRFLDDAEVARELGVIQRNRARDAGREAELILRLAELRPELDDDAAGGPGGSGARRGRRRTAAEFAGVAEFFPEEVAHAINLGRGTGVFRARRAFTWRDGLPVTFAALSRGLIDERRAGVLAEALQHAARELARAVEARLWAECALGDLSLAELQRRALALLAELDADAVRVRHEEAKRAADVRAYPTADGMGVLALELPAEQVAAAHAVVDALARMAQADGDRRPIGAIRAEIAGMLLLRPADHGLGGVSVQLTVTATLETLEGVSGRPAEVNGLAITAGQLRNLLTRVGALGLTTPADGSLTVAVTDQDGRLGPVRWSV